MAMFSILFWSFVVSVLGTNLLAWPPAFEENITCTLPDDYEYRKTGILALGVLGFNCVLYSSVGANVSPETGNVTGTFGSFYTQSFFETPPTLFLAGYDAAGSWSGGLDPISANVSGTSSFSALEFQSITGKYANDTVGTLNLAELTWIMGKIEGGDNDLNYVTFHGTSGNTTVQIDLCVSKVLGRLNWGADISPTAMKTRFTVSGFIGGPVKELTLTMVLATATINASVTASASTGVYQIVRRGEKRMAHSVTFEGALEVSCDGVNKPVVMASVNGSIDSLLGNAIKVQVDSLVGYQTDVQVITAHFNAGKETDVWVWDPTVASGVPPVRVATTNTGLTGAEIFGIVLASVVGLALLLYCYRRYRWRLRKAENAALVPEGQKTYI